MDPDRNINPPQNPLPASDPQNQTSTPSFSPTSQETTPPTAWSSDPNPPLVSQTPNQTSQSQSPESISQPMYQETPPMPPLPITTVPSSSSSSGFLRIFFIGIALILFGILIGVLAARFLPMSSTEVPAVTPTPIITITPSLTPEVTPISTASASANFICPANGWVDCMPILDEAKIISCSAKAMAWYKANCPNFQGAAL